MDGAGERANAIELGRKRDDAIYADTVERGFEANDAAKSGWDADGTAGIAADAAIAKAGGYGCGRATAGASGNAREIPRIVDGAEVRVVACNAVGEFVHVGLAE